MTLEQEFERAMWGIYEKAKSEAGYVATRFMNMLCDEGGLATAGILINSDAPSDGYTQLYMLGRLDLTVEALVVDDPKWHELFDEVEIDRARKRLTEYGYKFRD